MPIKFDFKIKKQHLKSTQFSFFIALFFVIFYNTAFFDALLNIIEITSARGILFIVNVAIVLTLLTFIVISIATLPYLAKPIISIVFIGGAAVAYFMGAYGIVIHRLMIQNAMETDANEVNGLFNYTLLLYIIFLGALPSLLIHRVNIIYKSFLLEFWNKFKFITIALIISLLLIFSMSKDYASFFRNHKEVRQMANPLNFIYAGISYFTTNTQVVDVKPIENDAAVNSFGKAQIKPTLFILVIGETVRADHWGINGYKRNTTPLLAKQQLINFTNFASCGTETAVSVPCMFSVLNREDYSDKKAKSQEGLLDVISHAGFSVLWRDNNSSCKGTCDRVVYEDLRNLKIPDVCNHRECFDEILLHQLDEKVLPVTGSKIIVLHPKGSHGPDYFNRYPENMEHFTPTCKDNQLQHCSKKELINAFDNTIRYADYFLNKTINWLAEKNPEYNTALLYLSDHGESLGEHGLYLHGMPYAIAPKEQKRVPFFLWISDDFKNANALDAECLNEYRTQPYSHDNLFHTVLGMLNISTHVYNAELDIAQPCRKR